MYDAEWRSGPRKLPGLLGAGGGRMSVLIRGMKMPKSCSRCFCMALCRLWKNIMHPEFNRHRNCPLAPVPPHGRLIDADALWVETNKICDRRDAGIITDLTCLQQILSALRHAPTIIPAEPCNSLSKPCKEEDEE